VKLFGKDLSAEIAVIAEVGVNHEGDVEAASRLLRGAAGAGADAIKFQSYTPERFISTDDPERFERVSRFALDEAAHRRLAAEAAALGVAFLSTPVTEDWVPLLAGLGAALKIASGDVTFEPVIRACAGTGLPVILSTGASTAEEIDQAIAWFRDAAGTEDIVERLAILHCVSAYPAAIGEANLRSIPFLAERYGLTVGWSNHVIGPNACLTAVALGARIIEVHVTDRREGRTFRDHALSFEMAELADLIGAIGDVDKSLGVPGKVPTPAELQVRQAIRKGIVAACDIAEGTTIEHRHLAWARPASGYAAGELEELIGAVAGQALRKGQAVPRDAIMGRPKA